MKLNITEKEALFLWEACRLPEGCLDYENNTPEEFLNRYGFTEKESDEIFASIKEKIRPILNKNTGWKQRTSGNIVKQTK